jgi:hypothetical protein
MAYKTIIGTMKTAGTLDISSGDIDLAAGSVDNADLAGSIANTKLANDSVTVTAGDGLSGGGEVDLGASVSLALDLNELTAATLAVDEDFIVFIDNDGNASRKEAFSDAITAVAKNNYGLAAGSGQLALSSSAMPGGTVAVASDKFIFFDADGSPKSEEVADLAAAFAGDGLAASSGVLAVGVDDSTVELSSDALRVKAAGIGVSHLATAVAGVGLSGGGGSALAVDLSEFSRVDIAAGDHFLVLDSDGSTEQLERVDKFSDFLAGDGLEASSGVLAVKLDSNRGLAIVSDKLAITGSAIAAAAVAVGSDELLMLDADGAVKREAFADYASAIAGDGIAASSGQLSIDLDELGDADGLDRDNDFFAIVDASNSSATKLMTATQMVTELAGNGLKNDDKRFALDLNELSAAAVDVANDKFPIVDATDGSSKLESVADLATAFAGDGLEASSGVLAVKLDSNRGVAIVSDKLAITGSAFADGTVAVGADQMLFLDADGSPKRETLADYAAAIAGDGLAASSGVLAVGVDDSSIELNSDALRVKASGVTNAMLAGSIANAKLANSTITVGSTSTALGGTTTAFSGLTGLDFTAANASIGASIGANTLTLGGAASHVRIAGNLEVVGTLDAVSATELLIEDKTIMCASGSANSSAADGAGLKIDGADATFLWNHSVGAMEVNEDTKLNGMTAALASISSNTQLTQKHFLVKVDTSGGAVTVTLPSSMPAGKVFVIKQAGHASNAVTIATQGSETIDGETSVSLASAYGAANLMFDGSNYLVW